MCVGRLEEGMCPLGVGEVGEGAEEGPSACKDTEVR